MSSALVHASETSARRRARLRLWVTLVPVLAGLALGLMGTGALADTTATTPADNVVRLTQDRGSPAATNESAGRTSSHGNTVSIGSGNPLPLPHLSVSPTGSICSSGGPVTVIAVASAVAQGLFTPPACPAAPGAPAVAAPPPPTPLQAAYQAWYNEVVLPDPSLSTSPTRTLTGLDTFLTIGGQQSVSWSGTALGQQVLLEVSSTYDVDWGDPRPDGSKANGRARITGTTSQGGPYPNGDLRHQYIERGSATIKVTQRWTAHWSAGGESGTLADRLLTTSSLKLPIDELQAIVTG